MMTQRFIHYLFQETLERLRERKQELKQETQDLRAELEDSKKAHR